MRPREPLIPQEKGQQQQARPQRRRRGEGAMSLLAALRGVAAATTVAAAPASVNASADSTSTAVEQAGASAAMEATRLHRWSQRRHRLRGLARSMEGAKRCLRLNRATGLKARRTIKNDDRFGSSCFCRCPVSCSRIFFRFVCAYCETPRCHNTIETGAGSRPAVTATPTARGSHYACDVPWSEVSLRPCGGGERRVSVGRERLRLGSPAHPAELGYAKKCADIIII